MTRIEIAKLVLAVVMLLVGLWTVSLLPFFVILLLADSIQAKPYVVRGWGLLKTYFKDKFGWVEWVVAILIAIWMVVFINANFVGIYTFHTSSMHGTLEPGDLLLVNKTYHGARKNPNNIKWFGRTIGFNSLDYRDVIVFNFPEGDTLLKSRPTESYYYLQRRYGKDKFLDNKKKIADLKYNPVDKRARFVKRVYGLPGDSIEISNGKFYANNKEVSYPEFSIGRYKLGKELKEDLLAVGIEPYDELTTDEGLTWEMYEKDIRLLHDNGIEVEPDCLPKNYPDVLVFPFHIQLLWNMHNMGALYVPKEGDRIELTSANVMLYRRCIQVFEGNDMDVNDGNVFINGKSAKYYTFKQDYYWVMGDNRPHSFDSRFWGFVPDNHIIGKVRRVLVSRDITKKWWLHFRGGRFWKRVE